MATADPEEVPELWLNRLSEHLENERYGSVRHDYRSIARRFLEHLVVEGLTVHTVSEIDVQKYLKALTRQRKSKTRSDLSKAARASAQSAIRQLLRLVHGRWPKPPVPQTERECFHHQIVQGYDQWMLQLRGLAFETRAHRCDDAWRFLRWLGERGDEGKLKELSVADLDAFIQWRVASLRRSATHEVAVNLRSLLRYLHSMGLTADLSAAVIGPMRYALEDIPSALRADEIERVLQSVRGDRSPIGLRDYAILMLLTTYGLRAGEITALRLEDIDWRGNRLRIYHSKTDLHSELPLLAAPGEALLEYLREGRPRTDAREVFLRANAPHRGMLGGSSLYSHLQDRLQAAGVTPQGRRGPHAFRHARAVSLLEASVPLKVIGDVLGHRATQSTMTYLKLDREALRGVALDLPGAPT